MFDYALCSGVWCGQGGPRHFRSIPRHPPQRLQLRLVCSSSPWHTTRGQVRPRSQPPNILTSFSSQNNSSSLLPVIRASGEELTWVGRKSSCRWTRSSWNITASVISLSMIPGSLLGGFYGGKYGPRRAVLVSSVMAALSWLLLSVSPHLAPLLLGRLINGLSVGFGTPNCALLVAQYR